ncbi:acyl-CoA N-acyltransferase [Artomyces pyxidatus]|uniref:Acyl-CoA N-acyltransferase n=1 Tax=Artomyces pyxidatus TaxID=48021 RepID=A0ACB8TGN2_9AGAM|nr:acyl-CoA N-acyltransferase [Artomyces pyxidatus]
MSFTNSYKPSAVNSGFRDYYGPDPYDVNFVFPLHLETLETTRVKLTPFIPAIYAQAYLDQVNAAPALQRWLPFDHHSLDELLPFVETFVRANSECVVFAIIDKPSGKFAGIIGLIYTSDANLRTEIGWVVVFPTFQRTYVASNAIGALLRYCLELPTASPPGLGLRRVQWTANVRNEPSVKAAQRMGFKMEGVMKWTIVLSEEKEGYKAREGDPLIAKPGRDSAMLAIYGEDWENGMKEHVQKMIDRV